MLARQGKMQTGWEVCRAMGSVMHVTARGVDIGKSTYVVMAQLVCQISS
jgi:hypothetical protein